ncbi:MAG: hypothetical protein AAB871_01080 [Patescibacteria group bacterium]
MASPNKNDYKELISEIIQNQVKILGPDIALLKAKAIDGLKIDQHGKVLGIFGDEQEILQVLVDKYIQLSGQIVKNILVPVFAKYPSIDVKIK